MELQPVGGSSPPHLQQLNRAPQVLTTGGLPSCRRHTRAVGSPPLSPHLLPQWDRQSLTQEILT